MTESISLSDESLAEMLDQITTATDLEPIERETILRWASVDERLSLYSDEPPIIRRFLMHPESEVAELRDSGGRRVIPGDYDGEDVTGIKGTLPIGAVKLSGDSRDSDSRRRILSDAVLDNDPR